MSTPEALQLAEYHEALADVPPASSENSIIRRTAAELRRLHAENKVLLNILRGPLRNAEWQDKHIYPVGGETHQNWLLKIYLPVPLSATDRSPEAALRAAIKATEEQP